MLGFSWSLRTEPAAAHIALAQQFELYQHLTALKKGGVEEEKEELLIGDSDLRSFLFQLCDVVRVFLFHIF